MALHITGVASASAPAFHALAAVGSRRIAVIQPGCHLRSMTDNWLSEIVVVNETSDEAVAGDVSIFRHAGDACAWLEHWWIEDKEGFAITAAGHRIELGVGPKREVIIAGMEAVPTGTDVVRSWLHSVANGILEQRTRKAKKGRLRLSISEAKGQLPTSSEELIAYIFMSDDVRSGPTGEGRLTPRSGQGGRRCRETGSALSLTALWNRGFMSTEIALRLVRWHPIILTVIFLLIFVAQFTGSVTTPSPLARAVLLALPISVVCLWLWSVFYVSWRVSPASISSYWQWIFAIPPVTALSAGLARWSTSNSPAAFAIFASLFVALSLASKRLEKVDAVNGNPSVGRMLGTALLMYLAPLGVWLLRPQILRVAARADGILGHHS